MDDLVAMKANKAVRPRPASATSIPGMLSHLQNEWDAVMSETYELKTHLDTTRKQLSHALYQHDAACRVIARLLRERDQARDKVAELQEQLANAGPAQDGPSAGDAELGFAPDLVQRMTEHAKGLSKTRKGRKFPDLTPIADVKKFACSGAHPIHQSTAPGILCVDLHPSDDTRIVTGGVDCQVVLFDAAKEKTAQKLLGHTKRVVSVAFHPKKEVVLSASQDATARVWAATDASNWQGPYSTATVVRRHTAEVTDVSFHPIGDHFLTSSRDKSWAFHDLNLGRCVRHVRDLSAEFGCMKFHPDGLILAGGCEDNTVQVWDIKDQTIVATLTGHEGAVEALSFSENGYYLASASRDGTVKLWDLRKPLNIQTLKVADGGSANAVRFDHTGQYLAVGTSTGVQVFNFETKSSLAATVDLTDHEASVMGVCFGTNARTLASVSMDRTLRLHAVK